MLLHLWQYQLRSNSLWFLLLRFLCFLMSHRLLWISDHTISLYFLTCLGSFEKHFSIQQTGTCRIFVDLVFVWYWIYQIMIYSIYALRRYDSAMLFCGIWHLALRERWFYVSYVLFIKHLWLFYHIVFELLFVAGVKVMWNWFHYVFIRFCRDHNNRLILDFTQCFIVTLNHLFMKSFL